MAVSDLSDLIDIGTNILKTEIGSDGTVTCQTGDVVTQQVGSDGDEWWQHVGFASRPSKPTPGSKGAEGITINGGDHGAVIASRDLRAQNIYGNLKEGETVVFAAGVDGNGQGRVALKQDGSVSMVTTDGNTSAGQASYARLGPDGTFEISTPHCRVTIGPLGVHMLHSSGAKFDLGAIAGLPGPLSALGSYAKIEAGIVSVKGGAVSVGTDGGAANEAATTLLSQFIAALVTAIGTITVATPGATAMASITPLVAPLVVAIAQIGKVV